MLAPQRHALILECLDNENTVSIQTLTRKLGVSRETVRKDIALLARNAKLEQVRGGATRVRTQEVPIADRVRLNAAGKARIARVLAARIPDGASLFLDNGSSTRALAEALRGHRGLVVHTNDFDVACILAPVCAELVMVGGHVDTREMATVGQEASDQADRYNVDISVVSAGGLTADKLISDFSREGVGLRDRILRSGQTGYVIADKEKFGVVGQFGLPIPKPGTFIVTDIAPPVAVVSALDRHGLRHIVADSE